MPGVMHIVACCDVPHVTADEFDHYFTVMEDYLYDLLSQSMDRIEQSDAQDATQDLLDVLKLNGWKVTRDTN